ncbi:MAG TPA: recombinase family protein [Gemmata sp.]|nr:recombinase family protein [Gemmata sp.]
MSSFILPVRPRNGFTLLVLIIARISGPHQDERSLDDQIALCKKYVRDRYSGPVEFIIIQGRGKGEYLERKELADAEAAVESCKFDLVIMEDIGRICRRNRLL